MTNHAKPVDLNLRAKEFGNMRIVDLLAFADLTGHELHIELVKPAQVVYSDKPVQIGRASCRERV